MLREITYSEVWGLLCVTQLLDCYLLYLLLAAALMYWNNNVEISVPIHFYFQF